MLYLMYVSQRLASVCGGEERRPGCWYVATYGSREEELHTIPMQALS